MCFETIIRICKKSLATCLQMIFEEANDMQEPAHVNFVLIFSDKYGLLATSLISMKLRNIKMRNFRVANFRMEGEGSQAKLDDIDEALIHACWENFGQIPQAVRPTAGVRVEYSIDYVNIGLAIVSSKHVPDILEVEAFDDLVATAIGDNLRIRFWKML